ncbi:hypothetical protein N7463_008927 [Penicillium fimorum]|uniref:Uncharacterized protein n=1 Tax=Penicillium fimorum TaxID=1882269 RepID=A0A9W9XQY7_9EURO|nr:hypothetical protein N7463_008927 [Penicillium fimorum]
MRFRNATISSFQPNTGHGYQKTRYYGTPMIIADSAKHSYISSVQMIYEPSQAWRHHVIPLVLDKFSVSLMDISMFATIPRIISSAQEGSPIYATCNAIACAYLATTMGSTDAIANKTRAYGVALRTVNAALDDPVQCNNDNTLLAVWMFVVYELLQGQMMGTATVGAWPL